MLERPGQVTCCSDYFVSRWPKPPLTPLPYCTEYSVLYVVLTRYGLVHRVGGGMNGHHDGRSLNPRWPLRNTYLPNFPTFLDLQSTSIENSPRLRTCKLSKYQQSRTTLAILGIGKLPTHPLCLLHTSPVQSWWRNRVSRLLS